MTYNVFGGTLNLAVFILTITVVLVCCHSALVRNNQLLKETASAVVEK